jgi:hypothetical protein
MIYYTGLPATSYVAGADMQDVSLQELICNLLNIAYCVGLQYLHMTASGVHNHRHGQSSYASRAQAEIFRGTYFVIYRA